jgi:hypothetical protein
MKPSLLLLFLAMTGAAPVMACLNGSHAIESVVIKKLPSVPREVPTALLLPTERPGKIELLPPQPVLLPPVSIGLSPEQKEAFAKVARDFEAADRSQVSFEQATDYAIALIYLGRYKEAIRELNQAEKTKPGSYITASALGTAYELSDDLKNAREWIGHGIVRDANSHEGTEWLHLDIIDAKHRLKSDAQWLVRHSTIQSREGKTPADILRAIEYQLNERLVFVIGGDAIVSDLFYQAGLLSDGLLKREYYFQQSLRFGQIREKEIREARAGG